MCILGLCRSTLSKETLQKKWSVRLREGAPLVPCLPLMPKNLSLIPSTQVKEPGMLAHTKSALRGRRQEEPKAHWPAGLAKLVNSRFSERLCLKS